MYFFPRFSLDLIDSITWLGLFSGTSAYCASLFAGYPPRVSCPISVRQCPQVCLAQLQHELLMFLLHMLCGTGDAPAKFCPCSGVCKVLKGNPD